MGAKHDFRQTVEFLVEQGQILHTTTNKDAITPKIDYNFHEMSDIDGDGVLNLE